MAKKSLPLKVVNVFFLAIIAVLCLILSVAAVKLGIQFQKYAIISDQYAIVSKASLSLQEASDYLTEQSRLFVISTEYEHLQNYFTEANQTKRREQAVKDIESCDADQKSIDFLKGALGESKKLEDIEYYSMKLVVAAKHYDKDPAKEIPEEIQNTTLSKDDIALSDEYKIAKAWVILFSQDYMQQKNRISELKAQAISEIFNQSKYLHDESLENLEQVFLRMMLNILGIFFINVVFFLCIIIFVIRPLYAHIKNIRDGKKLSRTRTDEFNVLTKTYNEMFDRNEANEILLRHKAEHDDLTGLLNRTAYRQIREALKTTKEPITLVLIDVDFFKLFNDNYGHSTGDKVLQRVADTLMENFRSIDYVARIGGDEFAAIMTNCDPSDEKNIELVSQKLKKIKKQLSEPNNETPAVTLSVGVDISHNGYSDAVYEHADLAMYEVKRAGRNDFAIYQNLPEEKKTASNFESVKLEH